MTFRTADARRSPELPARKAAALAVAALFLLLPACGGDGGTGPDGGGGGDGPSAIDLEVGESQVVSQPETGPLAFTLVAPSGGASFQLVAQSASQTLGSTAMRLALGGGGPAASVAASRTPGRGAGGGGLGGVRMPSSFAGEIARQRMRTEGYRMLARRGIPPAGRGDGQGRRVRTRSMLPRDETPQEGDQLDFWFAVQENGRLTCDTAQAEKVSGTVRAVGDRAAMVEGENVDLSLTQRQEMDFQGLADEFDRSVFGTDVGFFGEPSDIDGNGKVLVLFTSKVNEFGANLEGGIVAGFFAPTDLADSGFGDGSASSGICEASNEAEILWLLAPDPDGSTGDTVPIEQARRSARSTSAHEFQHLINAANRLFEQQGTFNDVAATWLDEGLSHLAEEVVGFTQGDETLRQNLGPSDVLANEQEVDIFNAFHIGNFVNAGFYLDSISSTQALGAPMNRDPSPITESLKMRGFSWLFLRWLADQEAASTGAPATGTDLPGSGEEAFFRRLAADGDVPGGLERGVENVVNLVGTEWPALLADFGATVAVDDALPQAPDRQQVLTWDLRAMFGELDRQIDAFPFTEPFPLTTTTTGFEPATFDFSVEASTGRYFTVSTRSSGEVEVELTDQTGAPLSAGSPQVTIIRIE